MAGDLVQINIFGREYSLRAGNNPEHIMNLAAYVNEKMNEIAKATGESRFGDVAALACLNIADDIAKQSTEHKKNMGIALNKVNELITKVDSKI